MDEGTGKVITPEHELKTSRLSITALVLSIIGYCTLGLTSVLAILAATTAIILIKRNHEKLKGTGLAVSAVVLSLITLAYLILNMQSVASVVPGLKMREVRQTLNDGRLAQLPPSARDIKVSGWHSFMSGERYLMFRAEPDEIETFIRNSLSLNNVSPEFFTSEHMNLPFSERESSSDENYYKHRRYILHSDEPKWFEPTIKVKGRRYEIPPDKQERPQLG